MGRWLWNKLALWAGIAFFSAIVFLIDIVKVPPVCFNGEFYYIEEEINDAYRSIYLRDYWVDFPGQDWPIERRFPFPKPDAESNYSDLVLEARLWQLMGIRDEFHPPRHPATRKYLATDLFPKKYDECRLMRELAVKGGRFEYSLPPGSFYRVDDEGNIIPQTEPLVPLFE